MWTSLCWRPSASDTTSGACLSSAPGSSERRGSDIDLLVEFEPGKVPGLLALASMEAELSGLLEGRPVDLRTPQDLSRYFREDVLRSPEVQYAR
jgi:predicted nucleotidyltransferase